VHIQGRALEN